MTFQAINPATGETIKTTKDDAGRAYPLVILLTSRMKALGPPGV